jgi:Ribbon-helix-helix protein, copG family
MISRMHTLSIKIDEPLVSTLAALSQRERVSKSELMRRALVAYAKQRPGIVITAAPSALDLAGDLVGCFSGAPADLSSNHAHMADFGRM